VCLPNSGFRLTPDSRRPAGPAPVTLPDARVSLVGITPGARHDSHMFRESRLHARLTTLNTNANLQPGQLWKIYGDSAYARSLYVERAHKGAMTAAQRALNGVQSSVRISVEWAFAIQMQQWAYLADERHLKLCEQPLQLLYFAGALLHNLHCLKYKGNLISSYFHCPLPLDRRGPQPWPLMTMHSYLH